MFLPDICDAARRSRSRRASGCGSPMIVSFSTPLPVGTSVPCVWPETRLIAPTVDGPKFVPKELSLSAKFWARFHSPVTVLPS